MNLFSAMTASVSGMAAQANNLATISENISNASTTGYKQTLTLFQDIVDQFGTAGDYSAGGVSTTIRYNVAEQGSLTTTTSPTDLGIQGNGFFLVENSAGATYLTRAGSFVQNGSGNLVNSAGYTLMGYSLAPGAGGVTNSLSGLVPSQHQRDGAGRHALDVRDFYRQSKFERRDADWRPVCHQLYQPVLGRCLRRSWQSGDLEYRFFENGGQHLAS